MKKKLMPISFETNIIKINQPDRDRSQVIARDKKKYHEHISKEKLKYTRR